jgi:hypothetical protein
MFVASLVPKTHDPWHPVAVRDATTSPRNIFLAGAGERGIELAISHLGLGAMVLLPPWFQCRETTHI